MTEKRFSTNGYYIYDHFTGHKWLVNEVDAELIVQRMNDLDTKARENGKGLSTLQKKLNELNDENTHIKNTITEMYNNERTELGKSTLKQLLEAIQ